MAYLKWIRICIHPSNPDRTFISQIRIRITGVHIQWAQKVISSDNIFGLTQELVFGSKRRICSAFTSTKKAFPTDYKLKLSML